MLRPRQLQRARERTRQRKLVIETLERMIVELEQSATCESSQAKLLKEFTSNGPVVPRKELQEVFKSEPETDDTTVMRQAMSRAKKRLEKENLRIETCYRIVPEDTTDY